MPPHVERVLVPLRLVLVLEAVVAVLAFVLLLRLVLTVTVSAEEVKKFDETLGTVKKAVFKDSPKLFERVELLRLPRTTIAEMHVDLQLRLARLLAVTRAFGGDLLCCSSR